MKRLGKQKNTGRGFPLVEFKDCNKKSCSLQLSSVFGLDHIWLGIDDPEPMVLASQAHLVGQDTMESCGWVPYTKIPSEVSLHTRMHLDKKKIKALINHLQTFLETGEFEVRKEDVAG